MTYNELKRLFASLEKRQQRSAWRNRERLERHGLKDGATLVFRGQNGRRYALTPMAGRGGVWLSTSHRATTLDKRLSGEEVAEVEA